MLWEDHGGSDGTAGRRLTVDVVLLHASTGAVASRQLLAPTGVETIGIHKGTNAPLVPIRFCVGLRAEVEKKLQRAWQQLKRCAAIG